MVIGGSLVCNVRRKLTNIEHFEWSMLCTDLGHVPDLNNGVEDTISILYLL